MRKLEKDCEEILRALISRHACLQLSNPAFDAWDSVNAKEIVADLIEQINMSSEIHEAHFKKDWGK